ncbi:hypothetical protein E2C01_012502 [Portunus trituberculatus]|uniref:Uncharacterized protein n=1 Tax=Portunus trituberculatus TaxID=210409 RepID=A0A5B7DEA4_PORTR|nr:hypothetical protein [Portunus trituberculatus]
MAKNSKLNTFHAFRVFAECVDDECRKVGGFCTALCSLAGTDIPPSLAQCSSGADCACCTPTCQYSPLTTHLNHTDCAITIHLFIYA